MIEKVKNISEEISKHKIFKKPFKYKEVIEQIDDEDSFVDHTDEDDIIDEPDTITLGVSRGPLKNKFIESKPVINKKVRTKDIAFIEISAGKALISVGYSRRSQLKISAKKRDILQTNIISKEIINLAVG